MQFLCNARWWLSITQSARHCIAQHDKGYVWDIRQQTANRKFDSQNKHVADSQNYKTNKDLQAKLDEGRLSRDKINHQIILIPVKSKLICQII